MAESWFVLTSGAGEPAYNMALDQALLEAMPALQAPVLRFYSWTVPAASFGYFQKIAEVELLTLLRPLVRRPTGGGIVPHDADWTYSLMIPRGHAWYELKAAESYRGVHAWLQEGLSLLGISTSLAPSAIKSGPGQCFAGYEQHDLLWQGEKIAGAAQRRTRDGLLVQGSVQPPPIALRRADWEEALRMVRERRDGAQWKVLELSPALENRAIELASAKYSQEAYNRRR